MMRRKSKNPAAVALGKLGGKARAKTLSAQEQSMIGKLGNAARNENLSADERQRLAKAAAQARWSKR